MEFEFSKERISVCAEELHTGCLVEFNGMVVKVTAILDDDRVKATTYDSDKTFFLIRMSDLGGLPAVSCNLNLIDFDWEILGETIGYTGNGDEYARIKCIHTIQMLLVVLGIKKHVAEFEPVMKEYSVKVGIVHADVDVTVMALDVEDANKQAYQLTMQACDNSAEIEVRLLP